MIAWETTFQIALRNCSKERGKIVLFIILGKRGMWSEAYGGFDRGLLLVTRS